MSDQYPSSPDAHAAEPVEHVDDVELLDPVPTPIDAVSSDIEGEAVDLDELEDLDESAAEPEQDDQAEGDQAAATSETSDEQTDGAADDSGAGGTGVLVLDTWQIQIPATGDATVDAALARLTDVEGLPPAQHADVYEAVHAGLHEALADLDRS